MGLLSYISGRLGLTINPVTGQRVRIRRHATDDWGNTAEHLEEKDEATGRWSRTNDVPGSGTGGHY